MGDMADYYREMEDRLADDDREYFGPTNEQEEREMVWSNHDYWQCPKGHIVLRTNRKTGQEFWGCIQFPACQWTHPRA